jgi:glycosyltransferase involved in cell wall biosynthesis
MEKPSDISARVLFVGPDDQFGGIGAVLKIYERSFRTFRFVPTYPADPGFSRNIFFLKALFRIIITLFKERKVKIIHIHAASRGSFIRKSIVLFLGKILRKKVIFHMHSGGFKGFYNTSGLFRYYISWIFFLSDKVICLSDDWLDYYAQTFPGAKTTVLPNPVDPAYNRLSMNSGYPIHFLFLGKICTEKGLFDLLDFFKNNIHFLSNRIRLHFGGNGDTDRLNQLIESVPFCGKIIYHGWVNHDFKIKLLSDCDVFILPSHIEGLPMSVLEAMAYSKPIIATDVGGVSSLVASGENGWLVAPHTLDNLEEALNSIFQHREILLDYGHSSLARSTKYHTHNVISRLNALYEDVLHPNLLTT